MSFLLRTGNVSIHKKERKKRKLASLGKRRPYWKRCITIEQSNTSRYDMVFR